MTESEIKILNKELSFAVAEMGPVKVGGIDIYIHWLHDTLETETELIGTHSHSTHELTIITEGAMEYRVGTFVNQLNIGDLIFIPAETPHSRIPLKVPVIMSGFMLKLEARESDCQKFIGSLPELMRKKHYRLHTDVQFLETTNLWRDLSEWDKPFSRELNINRIQHFLITVFQQTFGNELDSVMRKKLDDNNHQYLVSYVDNYLEERMGESIRLTEVAEYFNLSSRHFNRLFKSVTGKTFMDYVLDKKINSAQNQLTGENKLVKTIAVDLGFTDSAHFCRIFRQRTGITPKQFLATKKKAFLN